MGLRKKRIQKMRGGGKETHVGELKKNESPYDVIGKRRND